MKRMYALIPVLALVAALVVAGCGGSSSSGSSSSEAASSETASSSGRYGKAEESKPSSESKPAAATTESGEATTVSLGTAASVGKVLVDPEGMTLYYFEKDQKGSGKSTCEGACAEAWPPLLTEGEAEATGGVKASMLETIERSDGTTQVAYAGWPLYTFVGDTKPGEDNGTDSKAFGGSWYPIHSNGQKAGH